jgi:hypothetical protein
MPGLLAPTCGFGMPIMAREEVLEPLFVERLDGFPQAVEEIGARRVGEKAKRPSRPGCRAF